MGTYRWLNPGGGFSGKTFKLYGTEMLQNKIYNFVKEELNLIVTLAKIFKTNYDDAITSTFIC
jgi:hypothetical protein